MNRNQDDYFTFFSSEDLLAQAHCTSDNDTCWTFPCVSGLTIQRKIFRGGVSDGVEMFILTNDSMSVYVLPTRGMGIWKVLVNQENQPEKVRIGWDSPVRFPVNPAFVPLSQPDGLGWLRGFNEFVARCGLESNGAPEFNENGTLRYPLHGRIQNTPAHAVRLEVDAENQEVRLTGWMDEGRLFFNALTLESTLTFPFSGSSFRTSDTVHNRSARPTELELLYHINIGAPVAGMGARLEIPFRKQVPRCAWAAENLASYADYHAPVVGEPEMCYFYELATDEQGNTQTLLRNADGNFGVTVAFNQREFPYFCQWKAQHAAEDGYVTGLEPCLNFPNTRSFEQKNGRIAILDPFATRHFGLEFRFSTTPEQVKAEIEAVSRLQEQCPEPVIVPTPTADWCE